MKDRDELKKKFFLETRKLLEKHEREWANFRSHWDMDEYREAYLVVHSAIREFKVDPDGEYAEVDEDFYWSFIS